jgi:hypothetical protein
MIPTARIFPIHRFFFKGSLVDPRVRASNEHIPIVRVPRAGGRLGYPSHPSEAARCASTGIVSATPSFFSIQLGRQEEKGNSQHQVDPDQHCTFHPVRFSVHCHEPYNQN